MIQVVRPGEGKRLKLRGRVATELLDGEASGGALTVRIVEVEVEPAEGGKARPLHVHEGVGEFIMLLSGSGTLHWEDRIVEVETGTAVFVFPGQWHKVVPRGDQPLRLLCVFPTSDIGSRTKERS